MTRTLRYVPFPARRPREPWSALAESIVRGDHYVVRISCRHLDRRRERVAPEDVRQVERELLAQLEPACFSKLYGSCARCWRHRPIAELVPVGLTDMNCVDSSTCIGGARHERRFSNRQHYQ